MASTPVATATERSAPTCNRSALTNQATTKTPVAPAVIQARRALAVNEHSPNHARSN